MMSIQQEREAVEKGIALLDQKSPGWINKINPKALDFPSCTQCILGQVFGNFSVGSECLDLINESGEGHQYKFGFDADPDSCGIPDQFDRLQQLWLETINKRRGQADEESNHHNRTE